MCETVIIDGRIVLRDGEFTTVDLTPMARNIYATSTSES